MHTRGLLPFELAALARTSADDTRAVVIWTNGGVLHGFVARAGDVRDDHVLFVVPDANGEPSSIVVPFVGVIAFAEANALSPAHRETPASIFAGA